MLAADPSFADFAKSFPELKPGQKVEAKGAKLPLYALDQILGEPSKLDPGAELMKVGRLGNLPGPVALIVRAKLGRDDRLVLFTFDPKGKAIAHKAVASALPGQAGSSTDAMTIAAGGILEVETVRIYPMADAADLTELVTRTQTRVRVGIDGTLGIEETRGPEGQFEDAQSREVLFVSVAPKRVLYRGTNERPVQALVISAFDAKAGAATVAFSSAKAKAYTLAWSADRNAIVCTDPDGKAQTFKRVW